MSLEVVLFIFFFFSTFLEITCDLEETSHKVYLTNIFVFFLFLHVYYFFTLFFNVV